MKRKTPKKTDNKRDLGHDKPKANTKQGETDKRAITSRKRAVSITKAEREEAKRQRAEHEADQRAIKAEREALAKAIQKQAEREAKQIERFRKLDEAKAEKRAQLTKIASDKTTAKAKLHAIAQAQYKLRAKLAKTTEPDERKKIMNKLIGNNVTKEILNRESGIKSRKNSIAKEAEKRSGQAKGIKTSFDFRNLKDAKKNLAAYLTKGVKSVNGNATATPLDTLNAVDNLIMNMNAYQDINISYEPDTGQLNVWLSDEDGENEDGE